MGFWAALPFIVKLFIIAAASRMVMGAVSTFSKRDSDRERSTAMGHLVTKRSSKAVLPLLYGTCRVGINEVYIGTAGSENKSLYVIGVLGEGPIAGIVRADGSVFSTPDTNFPTTNPPLLYIDGILWTEHPAAGQITARYYAGSEDQGLCPLSSVVPEWDDRLRWTAYLYLRFYYDQDQWVGMPEVTVTVAGLELFDPTGGGAAYSDNPALVVYDMLTRPSARGGLGLGGWHAEEAVSTGCEEISAEFTGEDGSRPEGWTYVDDSDLGGTEAWCKIYDNGLKAYAYSGAAGSGSQENYASIACDTAISGDFAVTVDFSGLAKSGDGYGYVQAALVNAGATASFYVKIDGDDMYARIYPDGSEVTESLPPEETRFKWERSGTTVTISYWDGDEWVELTSETSSADDVYFKIYLYSILYTGDDFYIEGVFDNLCVGAEEGTIGTGELCERIDTDSIETAREYCADKGWTFCAPITEDTYFADNLQLVLSCFRGEVVYSEGVFKLRFRDLNEESTALALTMEDVAANDDGTSTLTLQPSGDLFDLPNAVKAVFINAEKKYLEDVYTFESTDVGGLSDGTDDLREKEVKLLGLNVLELVQKMSYYVLERARWGHVVTFSARDKCLRLEAGDLITLTHDTPGWTAQPLRVLATTFDPATHHVILECLEEDVDLYDDAYNPSELSSNTVTLPDPLAVPPDVLNGALSEEIYYYRGRSFTRLKVDFDPPDDDLYPWFRHAEIYVKIGEGEWRYMTTSGGDYLIDPAEEGETYWVRIRSVNIWGVKRPLASSCTLSRTVIGKTDVPPDLAGASGIVNGDTVTLMASPLSDPDIDGYEVRLGDSWDAGIFIAYRKAPTLTLVGVRPGTHTFWLAAKGNNGLYASNPTEITVTVFVPPGYSQVDTWNWDYDAIGTHSNTEHTTYSSADALICSHSSGVLTGTWTSPTYDLSSVQKLRLWGDFTGEFDAGGGTFDGVFSTTLKFSDIDPDGDLTFAEIFGSAGGARVQATLYYSEDNSNWDSVGYFEILCAEVEARYVKVAITITDPTPDSNYYLYALDMYAYDGPT